MITNPLFQEGVGGVGKRLTMKLYNDSRFKVRRRELRVNQTDAEKKLWRYLRNHQLDGFKFNRQYSVGRFILDFFAMKRNSLLK